MVNKNKTFVIIALMAILTLTAFISADIGEGGYGMMDGMYDWGIMGFFCLIFITLIFVALVLLIIWLVKEIKGGK